MVRILSMKNLLSINPMKIIFTTLIFISCFLVNNEINGQFAFVEFNESKEKSWPDCPRPNDKLWFLVSDEAIKIVLEKDQDEQSFVLNLHYSVGSNIEGFTVQGNAFSIPKTSINWPDVEKIGLRRRCNNNMNPSRERNFSFYQRDILNAANALYKVSGDCIYIKFDVGEEDMNVASQLVYFDDANSRVEIIKNVSGQYSHISKIGIDIERSIYLIHPSYPNVLVQLKQSDFNIAGTPLENAICQPELNLVSCGTNSTTIQPGQININFSPAVNQVLKVKGIPFLITALTGSNSGLGKISLPFDNSRFYKVNFSGITVDENNNLLTGSVTLDRGETEAFSSVNYRFQGEICQPRNDLPSNFDDKGYDENGLDTRGFDSLGINSVTMDSFDIRGFDVNGKHKTGGAFDEYGCDVNMKDLNGNECKPSQDVVAIKAFRDSLSGGKLLAICDSVFLLKVAQYKMDSLSLNCSAIRTEVNTLISTLQYPMQYIGGDSSRYINQGMSQNFASPPQKLLTNVENRNSNTILLENRHIDLYKCDVKEIAIGRILSFLNNENKALFAKFVDEEILLLSTVQLEKIKKDENEFFKWLSIQLNSFISKNGINPSISLINVEARGFNKFYSAIAKTGDDWIESDQSEEIKFLFEQNASKINGVERGIFVEELYDKMVNSGYLDEEVGVLPILKTSDPAKTKGTLFKTFFDNIRLTPEGAKTDIYLIFEENRMVGTDGNSQKIVFSAQNVEFGIGGFSEEVTICLESKVQIPVSNGLEISLNPGTCAKIDCDGFAGLQINAGFTVCRNLIIPHDSSTLLPLPEDSLFTLNFTTSIDSWNDLYFEFSGDTPFSVAGFSSVVWQLDNLVLDLSQTKSPKSNGGISLEYASVSPHFSASGSSGYFENSWEGLYINNLVANLPNQFKSGEESKKIGVSGAIIDGNGFSGNVYAANLIPFESGNMDGWQFSLLDFNLVFLANTMIGGGFGGKIRIPVLETPLNYTAKMFSDDRYEFNIQPLGKNRMEFLLGDVELSPSSSINLSYIGGAFYAKASLSGIIDISSESKNLNLAEVSFTNFEVSNQAPYFSPGNWGTSINKSYNVGGYAVNLRKIGLVQGQDEMHAGLALGIDVKLSDLDLAAGGDFQIMGKLNVVSGRQNWEFDKVKFNGFKVDATFAGGTKIVAELQRFEDDPLFGTGFLGKGLLTLPSFGEVGAFAVFGNKMGQNFFAVEALAQLNKGIQAGPISINGFGGGLSYRMNMDFGQFQGPTAESSIDNYNVNEDVLPTSVLANSLTGVNFTPDFAKGIGLQAFAMIELADNEKAFNGVVRISALFNSKSSGGGLDNISLSGVGAIMSSRRLSIGDLNNLTSGVNSHPPSLEGIPISAFINLKLGFRPENEGGTFFDGDIIAFMDAANGRIIGAGENKKLVDGKIVINSKEWYIYLGTPDSRCGIKLDMGAIRASATAYFDIGSKVPSIPPLPANVRKIASKVTNNASIRELGKGFVFGASFDISANLDLGIAKASAKAGVGFDLMMRQFEDAFCRESNQQVGINGWYAMGQMWAYIEGSLEALGINILEAGMAAVLQAQFPNPSSARGTVGLTINTIFGPWEGSLAIQLGDECTISQGGSNAANTSLGMDVIDFILPGDGVGPVGLNEAASIKFNLEVGKKIELPDINNNLITYLPTIDSIQITSLKSGKVAFNQVLQDNNRSLVLNPISMFSPEDTINLYVKVKITRNGVNPIFEERNVVFFTTKALTEIPKSNVLYSYPSDGMVNYYKAEYKTNKGFIQLNQGQADLLYDLQEGEELLAEIKCGQNLQYSKINYDFFTRRITYDLDPQMLINNHVASVNIVKKLNNNITTELQEPSSGNNEFEKQVLLTITFRVSKYDTFASKVSAVVRGNVVSGEPFDAYELSRSVTGKPILQISIIENELTGCQKNIIKKLESANGHNPKACGYIVKTGNNIVFNKSGLFNTIYLSASDYQIDENNTSNTAVILDETQLINNKFEDGLTSILNGIKNSMYNIITSSEMASLEESQRQSCVNSLNLSYTNTFQQDGCEVSNTYPDISTNDVQYLIRVTRNGIGNEDYKVSFSYSLPDGTPTNTIVRFL